MVIIAEGSDPSGYCSENLDTPDSWYPRSYAECLEWATKFKVIVWLFYAFTLVTRYVARTKASGRCDANYLAVSYI